MQPRRSLRLVAGALVLALPLLSSCGFNKATDKIYTPGEGTNNREGQVDVLAAVVVAAQPDSGTFMASLANNSSEDEDTFEGLAGTDEWSELEIADVSAITIPARGFVNLTDEGGVNVTGDFGAGDMMRLTLTFGSGQTTTMNVPVVFACDEYTGLDTSSGGGTSSSDSGESESPDSSESASPSTSGDAYDCPAVLGED